MANHRTARWGHGFVKTRKWIRPAAIDQMLDELNQSHFLGHLTHEYFYSEKSSAWGPHTWIVKYISAPSNRPEDEWGSRVFWLNTRRSFEIRHGGGTDFIWWIDAVIRNEVALRFNGMISDEGGSGRWAGDVDGYQTFSQFYDRMHDHLQPAALELLKQLEMEFIPPEHGGTSQLSDEARNDICVRLERLRIAEHECTNAFDNDPNHFKEGL